MTRKVLAVVASIGALVLALAACGSSKQTAAPTTTSSIPSATPPAASSTAAPTGATTIPLSATSLSPGTTLRSVPTCNVSDLRVSLGAPIGTAGAMHYQLVLNNASSSTCTLYGFPGLSFIDSHGHQIGPAAVEGGTVARQLVTLVPGAQGYVRLDVTDPGIPPCTGPGTVAQIRVYPPGSYAAALVAPPAGMQVCSSPNTSSYIATTVGPVTAAPNPGYAK